MAGPVEGVKVEPEETLHADGGREGHNSARDGGHACKVRAEISPGLKIGEVAEAVRTWGRVEGEACRQEEWEDEGGRESGTLEVQAGAQKDAGGRGFSQGDEASRGRIVANVCLEG